MLKLPLADIAVIVIYLVLITGLGVRLARYQTDSRAYFLGNRNIPWWAVCLSIVATETSVLTFIGVPALSYATDMQFLQLTLGYLCARVILAIFFLPAFLQEDTYTVYGYLSRRFGPLARNWAATLFLVTQVLGSGVRLYAAALVLATVFGWQDTTAAIVIIAAVTVLYTWAGGISAVIWTDVVQAGIMLGGGVLALYLLAVMIPESLPDLLARAAADGKLRVWDFSFKLSDTYTFWSGIVGGTFLGMASHGTDQVLAQRILTCRSLRDGRKAIVGSAFIIIPQFLLFLLIGVLLHYYYVINPPAQALGNPDRIFPQFIVSHFPPVAAGLVIAAMFGAAMSTLDSGIQALSSSTVMDLVRPLARIQRPASDYLGLSRAFTVFWGAALVWVALVAGDWGPVLETGLMVASFTYGPLLGLFILGFFTPVKSQLSVAAASVVGLAGIILSVRLTGLPPYTWYVTSGCLLTVAVGLLADLVSSFRK
ncbi:MAG TPA: sodium:solute symporter [archaeon]|nr:sodium:solute symporter [archaeon]